MNKSILVIPDTQVKPGVPLDHLEWASKLIVDRKPDIIVHLGDHWDMPSLSSYDKGTIKAEGKRCAEDILAGNHGMDILLKELKKYNKKQAKHHKARYKPELYFLMGNHEERIMRHVAANPELEGYLGYDSLNLEPWNVIPFKEVAVIEGIAFSHYFYNPMTGHPFGGQIETRLKNIGFTFIQGHSQGFLYGRKDLNRGGCITGVVAGSYYLHDEDYKGPQANDHWRGMLYLHDVNDGVYDLEQLSVHRMRSMYGKR